MCNILNKDHLKIVLILFLPLRLVSLGLHLDNNLLLLYFLKLLVYRIFYIDYINLDYDFHIYLAELTKNNYLIEVIGKLNRITNRFLMLSDTLEQHCRTAIDEHKTIVQFLKDGQKDYAEIAMRNHIINVGNRLL